MDTDRSVIIIVSFEGPDRYSQAGGLGVRVTGLSETLAALGYETHLFFVGDPLLPAEERRQGGRLVLHRWAQWISQYHPGGAYDGEEGKRRDLTASLPSYLINRIIAPAIEAGRTPVVMLEDWQTAECASSISDLLHHQGLRDRTVMLWNANNPYGFDRIDWLRLSFTTTPTAVSRYMRGIMRVRGTDAVVIPNGIPGRLMQPMNRLTVARLRAGFEGRWTFFKMARWEREKGWDQALDTVATLRRRGWPVTLIGRSGGPSGVGGDLARAAGARELQVREIHDPGSTVEAQLAAITRAHADVVSLRFGVSEALARLLYAGADGTLANSVSEPFGLVGLEAMAAGGVVFTGGTGEDYAVAGRNAVVLETMDPEEIADHCEILRQAPEMAHTMRHGAQATARLFTWDQVILRLMRLFTRQAWRQGLTGWAPKAERSAWIEPIPRPPAARPTLKTRPATRTRSRSPRKLAAVGVHPGHPGGDGDEQPIRADWVE